jgi:hypothetical protein
MTSRVSGLVQIAKVLTEHRRVEFGSPGTITGKPEATHRLYRRSDSHHRKPRNFREALERLSS